MGVWQGFHPEQVAESVNVSLKKVCHSMYYLWVFLLIEEELAKAVKFLPPKNEFGVILS